MAFIKSGNTQPPVETPEKPAMPALQSIFYWLAFLNLFMIYFAWVETPNKTTAILIVAIMIGASLLLFGIGQVIGYLGQTAYYARKQYEEICKTASTKSAND